MALSKYAPDTGVLGLSSHTPPHPLSRQDTETHILFSLGPQNARIGKKLNFEVQYLKKKRS